MKIGFIGMGHLGMPCALAIESRGHEVVGYDIKPEPEQYIKDRKVPYKEEGIQEYLDKTNIKFVDVDDMVGECDIIFVTVQTPHDPAYEGITRLPDERVDFDYTYLETAIRHLAETAYDKDVKQIVSIVSTVLPGTIDRLIKPIIELNENSLQMAYNPFFIAMGTCIEDFLYPEFVLLGMDNPDVIKVVENFYKLTLPTGGGQFFIPKIFKCTIKTAEAIKVLYNTFITQKILWANASMELCYHTGADMDDITEVMSLATKRIISPMYMKGGGGDSGNCHPRDCIALSAIARKHNISFDWWGNLMVAREKQTEWLANLMMDKSLETGLPMWIFGKAFKKGTNLTGGSYSTLVANIIVEQTEVTMWDPWVDSTPCSLNKPAIILIATNHPEFAEYPFIKGSIVIDPWRYIPDQEGVKVIRIGEGIKIK